MRITETQLRDAVRQALTEDREGFEKATHDIEFGTRVKDPTFLQNQKAVKRAWATNADHAFMDNLVKVHWVNTQFGNRNMFAAVKWFFESSGKDEISCAAYLPGRKLTSKWGRVGVLVEGTVTLAANDMDAVVSGYSWEITPSDREKHKSSGVPRRPTLFSSTTADYYFFDKKTFKGNRGADYSNEVIVDNWKVTGIVVRNPLPKRDAAGLAAVEEYAQKAGIPVINV